MRITLAAAVVGILLTTLGAAPADAATNTITVGSTVTLTDRVLATVSVTVVCDPLPGTDFDAALQVFLTQASGRAVATGNFEEETEPGPLFTCDGVTQNHFALQILPNPGSPPFHGGKAIVQAFFSIFSFSSGGSESGATTVSVNISG